MNRLALAAENETFPTSLAGSNGLLRLARKTSCRGPRSAGQSFCTFAPLHYEAGYAYPLVVWLHSSASSERELQHVMPLVSMRNYVAVAPRGPSRSRRHANRYSWQQTQDDIELAESRVADVIAAATRHFHVNPARVFVAGCGAGGTMAIRVAWNYPAQFAGVVSINGPLPSKCNPLRHVNELRRVPALLATSRDSRRYPASRVCSDLCLLHTAGCTVALRQYPGNYDLTGNMLGDMNRWLMELVCGTVSIDS